MDLLSNSRKTYVYVYNIIHDIDICAISYGLKNVMTSSWLTRLKPWPCRHATPHTIYNLVLECGSSTELASRLYHGSFIYIWKNVVFLSCMFFVFILLNCVSIKICIVEENKYLLMVIYIV